MLDEGVWLPIKTRGPMTRSQLKLFSEGYSACASHAEGVFPMTAIAVS